MRKQFCEKWIPELWTWKLRPDSSLRNFLFANEKLEFGVSASNNFSKSRGIGGYSSAFDFPIFIKMRIYLAIVAPFPSSKRRSRIDS